MSEEIDLGANNLCTTEDAFERFQAVSMYQEDEFITLSDIAPASKTGSDLIESIEDSHDEDTVSAPKHPQLHVNNVSQPDTHTTTQSVVKSAQHKQSDAKPGSETDSTTRVDRDVTKSTLKTYPASVAKRGRRKSTFPDDKNTTQEVQDLQDNDNSIILTGDPKTPSTSKTKSSFNAFGSDSTQNKRKQVHTSRNASPGNNEFSVSNTSTKTTFMPRKRGRPRKINTSNEDSALTEDTEAPSKRKHSQSNKSEGVNYDTQIEKSSVKAGKRTSTAKSKSTHNDNDVVTPTTLENNMLDMSSNEGKKKDTLESIGKKKRGRPRKQNNTSLKTDRAVKVTDTINTSGDTLKKNSDKAKNKAKKDLISEKKESIEDIEKYDRIEKELERLLSTPDLPDDLPEKDEDVQQHDSIRKKKVKIGIKSPSKPAQINQTEGKNKVQIDSAVDEEADDICLSKLKKQIVYDDESIINNDNDEHTQALSPLNNRDKTNTNEYSTKRSTKKPIMPDFEYNIDSVESADTTNNENDNMEDDSISIEPVEENMEKNIDKNMAEHKDVKEPQENVVEELVEQNKPDLNSTDINETEIESPSKRPVRRKAKKVMHYDEGSDEDPFANVELSDDEDISGRRGGRYCSDDEYLPGKENKRGRALSSESSDLSLSDINEINKELIGKKQSRKKVKKSDMFEKKGSGKKSRKSSDVTSTAADTTTQNDEDIEISIQSSDVSTNNDQQSNQSWGASNELEDFLAKKIQGTNLKIRKLSSSKTTHNAITPLEIPVLDPTEPKKTIEICTQTSSICTKTVEVQTSCPYEYTMKTKVPLTAKQSEKACEFLKGIVKTTSELGQLMTQKSEDFIQKKINIKQVTDTCKMDYCVQKSFLLFKLAKHNLIQMEEDLANEYERFLQSNDMLQYRESPKSITPKPQASNSDSDCEIVEETMPIPEKKKEKPQFNPKTVFLNKELSIKIAKKSADEPRKDEKLKIKGRHTVWLNDSIMVKKVKPTQSFLAQDSRNKKPPDTYVTVEMVRIFFDSYYKRQRALTLCAPFIGQQYLEVRQETVCNYFINNSLDSTASESTQSLILHPERQQTETQSSNHILASKIVSQKLIIQPQPLLRICTTVLLKSFQTTNLINECNYDDVNVCMLHEQYPQPVTLFRLSFRVVLNAMLALEGNSDTHKVLLRSFNEDNLNGNNYYMQSEQNYQPKTLFELSINVISSTMFRTFERNTYSIENYFKEQKMMKNPFHLKSLCQQKINKLISGVHYSNLNDTNTLTESIYSTQDTCLKMNGFSSEFISKKHTCTKLKTLLSLCVKAIQRNEFISHTINSLDMNKNSLYMQPKLLKCIAFEKVRHSIYRNHINDKKGALLYIQNENGWINKNINEANQTMSLTIHSVNSVSDDVFLNIPDTSQCLEDENSDFSNEDVDMPVYDENGQEDNQTENFNWVSMVQMRELKSCVMPNEERISNDLDSFREKIPSPIDSTENCAVMQIKIEPFEETADDDDNTFIKTEPKDNIDDANFTPFMTKVEREAEYSTPVTTCNSYDVDAFESFVRTNKLLHGSITNPLAKQEYFNQSVLKDRMQYESGVDDDIDMSMSLLVPQSVELVKDRLMESSSDDGTHAEKKIIKKKRKMQSKSKRQDKKNKNVSTNKHKSTTENEVAVLTRKMQERIRQEQNHDDSSDSELENPLSLRRDRDAAKMKTDNKTKKNLVKSNKESDDQIQCNDVDSTEQIYESVSSQGKTEIRDVVSTERDIKSSKMLTRSNNKKNSTLNIEEKHSLSSSVIHPEAPVELLECEPTLPIMDENIEYIQTEDNSDGPKHKVSERQPNISYIERHGWKCYPVDYNDTKLYEFASIQLEKLPEKFVETYFKYQGMADKSKDDTDIERLTNLQSLHRNQPNQSKENKGRGKIKEKGLLEGQFKSKNTDDDTQSEGSSNDNNYAELTPSEDEEANVDDELPPPASQKDPENVMAKNSLMDDNDSDSEKANAEGVDKKIKSEPSVESDNKINTSPKEDENKELSHKRKYRPGPKSSKCKTVLKEINSLMLTADKMMNKELTLLHAPVTLNDDSVNIKDTPKKSSTKNSNRTVSKHQAVLDRAKVEEDSSSEEEKQWVNTKEKLLKKMVKKQGNPSVDDAKRAKIVSEFIERRVDRPECRLRGKRCRRSSKKFLERQKQMSVLKKELFGEVDASHTGRKHSSYGKGRKNIRKVIDKKSLARTTVVSNMEEFERKRRLNMTQTRLRELLGFEEGVNVLVINDEVCLEYDFEAMRPVVTIHPFFTKVMKAHQYEGVKFMWDACFESLSMVEAGHPGGGCILAHCMGLGKTLQVLALLHTVLTHPRVGMHRVLVCCPLSTVLNWVDEIHKWIGPVTEQIKVFELSKLRKTYERAYQLEDWYNGGGIFIIGYELFRSLTTLDPILDDVRPTIVNKIRTALLDPGPDVIICDEGHLLKNDSSVLAVAMSRVATRRRIILTGTPMQNNLREYYCMVNFVKPSLLGTYSEYSNRFENPIMNGQHRDSQEEDIKLMKTRTHILHKVLEGCLQRQEASVLYPYLPKKHEYTVFIPPTKCQWDLYKHYIMTYAMQQQQKQSVLKDFHVLQKIWTHPQVLHNFLMKGHDERNKIKMEKIEDDLAQADLAASEDVKPSQTEVWWLQYLEGGDMLDSLESSNKFLVVFQLIDECIALGDKILIFSTSLYTMDALEYFLKRINKWTLGQEYYRLDGSVPAEVRQKWCREFNAENNLKTKLFLISTRAGSLGLNMTAANRVIILDTSWNPAHDIQSIFRVYRFGQKKDCYIYRLVAMGTMEQKIYERSVTKQAVACRVVDEQQIDRHYNMAELTELYRYDEEGSSVEAGLAAGVADVALLRVAARARLHAVREHDSLLRGSREQHLPEHERAAAWFQFQQEHAHTEMQNRLLDENQGIHQIFGHTLNNLSMPSGSTEIKIETGEQPTIPPIQYKGKKKKKSSSDSSAPTVVPSPEPSTGQQKIKIFDSEKEEAKVKKIMQILIQHNFHTTKPATDISQLVANVRKIVADGQSADLTSSDELTLSIAKVLLQEEEDARTTSALADVSGNTDNTDGVRIKQEIEKDATLFKDSSEASLLVPYLETSVKLTGTRRLTSPRNETVRRSARRVKPRKNDLYTEESILSDRAPSSEKIDEAVAAEVIRKKDRQCKFRSSDPDFTLIEDSDSNVEAESNIIEDAIESTEGKQIEQPQKKISEESNSNKSGKRTKRKAALVAEKHISSFRDDEVVTLDDDDDEWVADGPNHVEDSNIGNRNASLSDSSKEETQTKSTLSEVSTIKKYGKPKKADKLNKISDKTTEAVKNTSSIVLSDDDEPLASANFNKSEPIKSCSKTNNTPKAEVKTNENVTTEKLIPLHKSLLTNKNFIKIVAHTYLSGNPMLDEDAALLAAQYSTQKALTEIETTGKELISGAVYDIAVKVLGIDILKKLYDSKGKAKGIKSDVMNKAIPLSTSGEKSNTKESKSTKSAKDIVDETSSNTTADKTVAKLSADILVPETESANNKKPVINPTASTIIIKKQKKHASTKPAATSQQSTPNVVPVGMFMGSQYNIDQRTMEAVEESILPDDDDVIIGCTSESSTSAAQNYQRRNSQQFTINSVTSSTKADSERMFVSRIAPSLVTTAQPQNATTLIISGSKIISTTSTVANKSGNTVPLATSADNVPPTPRPSTSSDTICLDSDDEDLTNKFTLNLPPPLPSHKLISIKPKLRHTVTQAPVESITGMSNYSLPQAVYPVQNNFCNVAVDKNQLELADITSNSSIGQRKRLNALPRETNYRQTAAASDSNPNVVPTILKPLTGADGASPLQNAKKVCKPGDIVVITKTGALEVLSRVDKPKVNQMNIAQKLPQPVTVPVENVSKLLTTKCVDNKLQETSDIKNSVSQNRKPNAPNDHNSIFKDVIHIQADEYEVPKLKTPPEPQQSKPVNASGLKLIRNIAGTSKASTSKTAFVAPNTISKKEALKLAFKNMAISAFQSKTTQSASKKVPISSTSSTERKINRGYDLIKSNKSISIKYPEVYERTKAPNNFLTKGSTPNSKTCLSSKIKSSGSSNKAENKKRSSPWPEASSQKKKTDDIKKPMMTLKDFNLDDFDDIIELE